MLYLEFSKELDYSFDDMCNSYFTILILFCLNLMEILFDGEIDLTHFILLILLSLQII